MYQLPGIILDLLGDGRPSLLRLAATSPDAPVRPLPGMHFLTGGEQPLVCRKGGETSARCETTGRWLRAIITLTQDLFGGFQHILSLEHSPDPGGDKPLLNTGPAEKTAASQRTTLRTPVR